MKSSGANSPGALSNTEQFLLLRGVVVRLGRSLVGLSLEPMSTQNSVVAIYRTHLEADQAVKELQGGGVYLHKLSIVGKGHHTDEHERWA
jgi:hypothetical protein